MKDRKQEAILSIFPAEMKSKWEKILSEHEEIEEIRLRAERPVILLTRSKEILLSSMVMEGNEIQSILQHLCQYSVYAYEEEMRQGFLTIQGGHRVGFAGQAALLENGEIKTFRRVQYMNIRIAREKKNIALGLLPYVYEKQSLKNCLLVSPPAAGKTTMLRDLVRLVSDGNSYGAGRKVGIVDERSEIAGSFHGIPQNDVGIRTDVLDACPKATGMLLLIRSMSPEVLAVDEIGTLRDAEAMHYAFSTGCKVLATIHGSSMEDIRKKRFLSKILEEHSFERFIFLEKREGRFGVNSILDENGVRVGENGYK